MPELPEVEVVRRQLIKNVLDKEIINIQVCTPKIVSCENEECLIDFSRKIINHKITDIERIGKLLIFKLNRETDCLTTSSQKFASNILCHLKMTGQLIYQNEKKCVGGGHYIANSSENLPHKHTHIILTFKDDSKLFYNDLRQFGYFRLASEQEVKNIKNRFGIEPLQPNFTLENFSRIFRGQRKAIKALLLDQHEVAGLGNIYVDEVCFASKILPMRQVQDITPSEISRIFKNSETIIAQAIENGGTTFSDFLNVAGGRGNFREKLQVFGRTGLPCYICGNKIAKTRCAGRGTHFCPNCQT